MRLATLFALGLGVTFAAPAMAQTYAYTARTAEKVKQSGTVVASGLKWRCSEQACFISGPWAVPGVSACAALAQKVGPITAYGHSGARLTAKQLEQCNSGLPAPLQLSRQAQQRVPLPQPLPGTRTTPATKPATPPPPSRTSTIATASLAIEEGGYQDYTLYIHSRGSLAYHGTYTGTHPPLPSSAPRVVAWSGNLLRLPGLSHRGTDDRAEATVPAGSVPADSVVSTSESSRFVEIPLDFQEFPQRVSKIQIECVFSAIPANTGVYDAGAFNVANQIGFAEGSFWRRAVSAGDWNLSTTARLPLNLRHFMAPTDVKSAHCGVRLFISRVSSTGIDQVLIQRAADPGHASFLPGMAAAPGSAPAHEFTVNVGG